MRVIIVNDYQAISQWAANYVAGKINAANPTPEKPFILGCPTGSSPLGMYKALIEFYKEGKVSFENVVTFNMDEYVGLPEGTDGNSLRHQVRQTESRPLSYGLGKRRVETK